MANPVTTFLACYDPGSPSLASLDAGSDYWQWHDQSLSSPFRQKVYYDVLAARRPSSASVFKGLVGGELVGGCCAIDDSWLCWYRFADGGADVNGRPGRMVIFAAFIRRADAKDLDTSIVLNDARMAACVKDAYNNLPPEPPAGGLQWVIACEEPGTPDSLGPKWHCPHTEVQLQGSNNELVRRVGKIVAQIGTSEFFDIFIDNDVAYIKAIPAALQQAQQDNSLYSAPTAIAGVAAKPFLAEQDAVAVRQQPRIVPHSSVGNSPTELLVRHWRFLAAVFFLGLVIGGIVGGGLAWSVARGRRSSGPIVVPGRAGSPSYQVHPPNLIHALPQLQPHPGPGKANVHKPAGTPPAVDVQRKPPDG